MAPGFTELKSSHQTKLQDYSLYTRQWRHAATNKTHRKQQKSLKGDITQHHVDFKSVFLLTDITFHDFAAARISNWGR